MRYEMMRPKQINAAVAGGLPLLMPVGVLEYHGHHNPVGVDALITQGLAHAVEARIDCVVAPTMFYGFTGEWAADERLGEIHVDGEALYRFVKPIVKAFLRQGWYRIYILCHHQGPKGVTHLSYQRAASESGMEIVRERHGAGWFRHANWHEPGNDNAQIAFNTVRVVSDAEYADVSYGGHGGCDETSAMLFFYPETVALSELQQMQPCPYWAEDAEQASLGRGAEVGKLLVDSWVARLAQDRCEFQRRTRPAAAADNAMEHN